jgi:hypothetical protein
MSGETIEAEIARLTAERDNWQQRAEAAERASKVDADVLQTAQQWISESNGKINVLTEERDAAERERAESRAEVVQLRAERDVALAEAEGLRADLLAHPPETHTELAAERLRHIELMEDYDRREVVITTLEDALKRAENALKVAQGQHIDERLKGFLAVISQLADQAQDLIP